MLIFTLALAVTAAPLPLTQAHQRDIACVAFFGLVANITRNGINGYGPLPDMKTDGPRWAGIVGERVMRETGQPQELVGFAIQEAVVPVNRRTFAMQYPSPAIERELALCQPIMKADLEAADAADAPLPKPVKAPK
jgi:hypothetical protein